MIRNQDPENVGFGRQREIVKTNMFGSPTCNMHAANEAH
jgi:hypothetical protein